MNYEIKDPIVRAVKEALDQVIIDLVDNGADQDQIAAAFGFAMADFFDIDIDAEVESMMEAELKRRMN